ncbi:MAG: hypothetical protein BWY09_01817 [Candidatus Hydrogenedentes bacterium ADurb.Bin179]|nr:MAG: hypothetical protein BWY09_01817 [Candidatus Hydrogenedentes bacterium ADurb.Bin179]
MIFLKRMKGYEPGILLQRVTIEIRCPEIQKRTQGRCFHRLSIGKPFPCIHHNGRNKEIIGERPGWTAPSFQTLLPGMPRDSGQQGQEKHFEKKRQEKL